MNFWLIYYYSLEISKKQKFIIACICFSSALLSIKCLETLVGQSQISQPEHKNSQKSLHFSEKQNVSVLNIG